MMHFGFIGSPTVKERYKPSVSHERWFLAPLPFLLGEVLEYHLQSWEDWKPNAVAEIEKKLYVDDPVYAVVNQQGLAKLFSYQNRV